MRFAGLVGLQWKAAGQGSLASGIAYSTAPTDHTLGTLAIEQGQGQENVYELVRVSGTCTVGSLLYQTGTNNSYVVKTGTGAGMPYAISMDAPTVSGTWQWAQKYGINTTIQITNTVGGSAAASSLLCGGESAAGGVSTFYSNIASGTLAGLWPLFGRSLTAAAGSTTIGFIKLL